MMTTDQRAELDAAMEKATKGPWGVWVEPCAHPSSAQQELVQQVEQTEGFVGALYMIEADGKCPATTGCGPTSAANAAAIVALHNAYPLLTATIDAQAAEIADCEANINLKADFIEATINQLAQADETIARLREALGDMMELFSADDYYMAYRAGSQHQSVRLAAARAALASTGAA